MTSKQELRRHFRQRRQQQLSLSSAICRQVLTLVQSSPIQTGRLGLYWPLNGEVDLRSIRAATPSAVALPVADGVGGLTDRLGRDTPLQADGCGIPAPVAGPAYADQLSLLLVPALAIDHTGIRLGAAAATTTGCALIPPGQPCRPGWCFPPVASVQIFCPVIPGMCPSPAGSRNTDLVSPVEATHYGHSHQPFPCGVCWP